jgi:hypothetical protein
MPIPADYLRNYLTGGNNFLVKMATGQDRVMRERLVWYGLGISMEAFQDIFAHSMGMQSICRPRSARYVMKSAISDQRSVNGSRF